MAESAELLVVPPRPPRSPRRTRALRQLLGGVLGGIAASAPHGGLRLVRRRRGRRPPSRRTLRRSSRRGPATPPSRASCGASSRKIAAAGCGARWNGLSKEKETIAMLESQQRAREARRATSDGSARSDRHAPARARICAAQRKRIPKLSRRDRRHRHPILAHSQLDPRRSFELRQPAGGRRARERRSRRWRRRGRRGRRASGRGRGCRAGSPRATGRTPGVHRAWEAKAGDAASPRHVSSARPLATSESEPGPFESAPSIHTVKQKRARWRGACGGASSRFERARRARTAARRRGRPQPAPAATRRRRRRPTRG